VRALRRTGRTLVHLAKLMILPEVFQLRGLDENDMSGLPYRARPSERQSPFSQTCSLSLGVVRVARRPFGC
jgi:hypothetical protein